MSSNEHSFLESTVVENEVDKEGSNHEESQSEAGRQRKKVNRKKARLESIVKGLSSPTKDKAVCVIKSYCS